MIFGMASDRHVGLGLGNGWVLATTIITSNTVIMIKNVIHQIISTNTYQNFP